MTDADPAEALVELPSRLAFEATLRRLVDGIRQRGMTLFATIDQAAAATAAGLSMPSTTVLVYGNPAAGTPVMVAVPAAALDLPLRVMVREDAAGAVIVSYRPVAAVLRAAGVPPALAERLTAGQRWIAAALADDASPPA